MNTENTKLLDDLTKLIIEWSSERDVSPIMDKIGELLESDGCVYFPFIEHKGYEDRNLVTKGINTSLDGDNFLVLGTDENVMSEYDVDLCYTELYYLLHDAFFKKDIKGVVIEADDYLFPISKYDILVLLHIADYNLRVMSNNDE